MALVDHTGSLQPRAFIGKLPVPWPTAVAKEPINSGDGKTPLFQLGYGITPY